MEVAAVALKVAASDASRRQIDGEAGENELTGRDHQLLHPAAALPRYIASPGANEHLAGEDDVAVGDVVRRDDCIDSGAPARRDGAKRVAGLDRVGLRRLHDLGGVGDRAAGQFEHPTGLDDRGVLNPVAVQFHKDGDGRAMGGGDGAEAVAGADGVGASGGDHLGR